jgi:hypothetical protein
MSSSSSHEDSTNSSTRVAAEVSSTEVINLKDYISSTAHHDEGAPDIISGSAQLQHHLTNILLKHASLDTPVALYLTGLEASPPNLISVLNNVLSESGNLQRDGLAVQARSSILVFPVVLPEAEDDRAEQRTDRNAKDQLMQVLKATAGDQGMDVVNDITTTVPGGCDVAGAAGHHVEGLLSAFRRRIDLVVITNKL